MTDIVERLRDQGKDAFAKHYSLGMFKLCADGADEIERLRKGIQDYLDGNYPHSRSYRPDACPHGLLWFNGDCDQCIEEHFRKLLDHQ